MAYNLKKKYLCRHAGKSISILACSYSSIQAFRHSSNQAIKQSCVQVRRLGCMHVCRLAFLPARLNVVIHSNMQVYTQASRCSGSPALPTIKKILFKKKTEKGKKEKESNLKGRDADRLKGIGISPEGCLVRNEQGIMPKSFCQTGTARRTFGFFFIISFDKNINNNR